MNALSAQYIRLLVRDSAEYFEALANKEAKALGYIHGIAESISNQSGIVEYFDNDFVKSEALAKESIGWFEKTSNKNGIGNTYGNLSFAVFSESKYGEDYQIAKWQYEKSLIAKDTVLMYNALGSMGVIHYHEGNYDSAFYKIAIPTAEGFELIPTSEVLYFEAADNYTHIYLKNKNKIIACRTLKKIEEQIQDFNFFVRVHNSYMVNLNEVIKYVRGEGGYLVMSNNSSITVSRSRKDDLLKFF